MAEANNPSISIDETTGNVTLVNHPITYLNFEGRGTTFNAAGSRNFHSVLTEEEAALLAQINYNVKQHEPNPEIDGAEAWYSLQVKVQFGGYKPPVVVMITSKGQQIITEDKVAILDAVDIKQVDVVIRPYDHNRPGMGTGRAAYLKTMFITIDEDELMMKYGFQATSVSDEPPESPF